MKKARFAIPGLLIIVMVTAFAGAGLAQQQGAMHNSMVRVIHASPGSPPVDVYVDGKLLLSKQAYRHVSNYLNLPPGSHHVRIITAGSGPHGTPLISETVNVRPNEKYSLMAVGNRRSIHLLPVVSNQQAARGTCKIRFVHASPDSPPVDVAIRGGRVLFHHVSFRNASDYIEIKPTTANLEIREAGTQKVLLDMRNVRLKPDNLYSLYALGLSKGQPGLEGHLTVDANIQPSSMPKTGMGGASMR